MDCGPACLKMVAAYYGMDVSLERIRNDSGLGREGVSLLGISHAAERIYLHSNSVLITFRQLVEEVTLPAIVHWNQNHFVVVTPSSNAEQLVVADPASGMLSYTPGEFMQHWGRYDGEHIGTAFLLEPAPGFYTQEPDPAQQEKSQWNVLGHYLRYHKRYFIQVMICLLTVSGLQVILPFLTQSIIDVGINTRNLNFIYIILIAQFVLLFSKAIVDFIRGRLLLYISTSINLSILSGFWNKLLSLPISFHDTKLTGDILQRINDHKRIESFLTGSALNVLFSAFSLVIFSVVLAVYETKILLIYLSGTLLYFIWISIFLKQRRKLDFKRFNAAAKENAATMQLIHSIQDIKLNNAEKLRRQEWETLQAGVFKLGFKNLSLSQLQQTGAFFLNEGKNILITFFVAKAVLDGNLTLGTMMAIQYIIGQLNSPVEQLTGFTQLAQDARISMERLNDIHGLEDEEPASRNFIHHMPQNRSIHLDDLSFAYPGAGEEPVLKDIRLSIPEGKVTAIVGMSGSGKTTLLKLLLRFYNSYDGNIKVGETNLRHLSPSGWRQECGVVMQDGYIYNDTIARNIAANTAYPDYQRLLLACKIANILSFIESLPLGFDTKIGNEGVGLSQGQKQRLLIARSVYKDPHYIFFDEATNALDANNERIIIENLQEFFENRTVVVIAHRLSTVRHADNIIVLEKGRVIESGVHADLIQQKGKYYQLVSNQLELGK